MRSRFEVRLRDQVVTKRKSLFAAYRRMLQTGLSATVHKDGEKIAYQSPDGKFRVLDVCWSSAKLARFVDKIDRSLG